jgi:uncharacterized protein
MKYLIWLVIVLAVVTWFKRTVAKLSGNPGKPGNLNNPGRPARGDDRSEAMCQCAQCGTYFPASEAIRNTAGVLFCSEEHRAQHGRA